MKRKFIALPSLGVELRLKRESATDCSCEACGEPLYRLKWNTSGDILVCENVDCPKFHSRQGFIRQKVIAKRSRVTP